MTLLLPERTRSPCCSRFHSSTEHYTHHKMEADHPDDNDWTVTERARAHREYPSPLISKQAITEKSSIWL